METFLCRGWTARSRSTIQNRFLQAFARSLHRATSARPDVFTVPPQIMSSAIRYNTSQLHNTLPRLYEISNRGVIPFRYGIIHQDHQHPCLGLSKATSSPRSRWNTVSATSFAGTQHGFTSRESVRDFHSFSRIFQ